MTRKLRNVFKDAWAVRNSLMCILSLTSIPDHRTNIGEKTLLKINVGVDSRCRVPGKIHWNEEIDKMWWSGDTAPQGAHLLGTHGGQPWRRHGGHWGHADLSCHLVHVAHPTCVGRHGYIDVHIVIVHAGVCLLPKVRWGLLWKHAGMQWKDDNVSAQCKQAGSLEHLLLRHLLQSEEAQAERTQGGTASRCWGQKQQGPQCSPRLQGRLRHREGREGCFPLVSVRDKLCGCPLSHTLIRMASRALPSSAVSYTGGVLPS